MGGLCRGDERNREGGDIKTEGLRMTQCDKWRQKAGDRGKWKGITAAQELASPITNGPTRNNTSILRIHEGKGSWKH